MGDKEAKEGKAGTPQEWLGEGLIVFCGRFGKA